MTMPMPRQPLAATLAACVALHGWMATSPHDGHAPPAPPVALDGSTIGCQQWNVHHDGARIGRLLWFRERGERGGERHRAWLQLRSFPGLPTLAADQTLLVFASTEFTSAGQFTNFDAKIQVAPSGLVFRLTGVISDNHLIIRSPDAPAWGVLARAPLDGGYDSVALGPFAQLPRLFPGKTWTSLQLGVAAPANSAAGILAPATHRVSGQTTIPFHGESAACYIVESDAGAGPTRCWVRTADGLILRQEVRLGDATLTLEAAPPPQPTPLAPAAS